MSKVDRVRNLEALAAIDAGLADRLRLHRPNSMLVQDHSGGPDISAAGRRLFGGRMTELVAEQLAEHLTSPKRFVSPPAAATTLDRFAHRFEATLKARANDAGLDFAPAFVTGEPYFLIVFGVGLGAALPELAAASACRHMIIADFSLDALYHSLEAFDWAHFLAAQAADGRRVGFAIYERPDHVAHMIGFHVKSTNPCSMDGTAFFIHTDDERLTETLTLLQTRELHFAAVGFFFDETLMVQHTYRNLKDGRHRVFRRRAGETLELPCFVIGSGPSLDRDIEFIKENAHCAVIVSCGSALRPLLRAGVMPDFQIETENWAVRPIIAEAADEFGLSKVTLVAAASTESSVLPYFDETIVFFRKALSTYPLFCEGRDETLAHPDPTVANGGFSFAESCGFKHIHLFGVDLGKRSGAGHHAGEAYYFTEGAVDPDHYDFFETAPANFGGDCQTNPEFLKAAGEIGRAIRSHQGAIEVFNGSDGLMIEGAEPLASAAIELADGGPDKAGLVAGLVKSFPAYSEDRFEATWRPDEVVCAIDAYELALVNAIAEISGDGPKRHLDTLLAVARPDIGPLTEPVQEAEHTAAKVFRGTVLMMVAVLEYHLSRVTGRSGRERFTGIVKEEFAGAFAELAERARALFRDPMADVATFTEADGEGEAVPEMPVTWGKVARNAPCPCGSGKKYKHCHGKIA